MSDTRYVDTKQDYAEFVADIAEASRAIGDGELVDGTATQVIRAFQHVDGEIASLYSCEPYSEVWERPTPWDVLTHSDQPFSPERAMEGSREVAVEVLTQDLAASASGRGVLTVSGEYGDDPDEQFVDVRYNDEIAMRADRDPYENYGAVVRGDLEALEGLPPVEDVSLNPMNGTNDYIDLIVSLRVNRDATNPLNVEALMDDIWDMGYRVIDIDPYPSTDNASVEFSLTHIDRGPSYYGGPSEVAVEKRPAQRLARWVRAHCDLEGAPEETQEAVRHVFERIDIKHNLPTED